MSKEKSLSPVRLALKTTLMLAVLAALLFVPAGTLDWPEAWIFISLYLVFVFGVALWWRIKNPGLLKERAAPPKDARKWDRKLMSVYSALLIVYLILPGLDVKRFGWSDLPDVVKWCAFFFMLQPLTLILWAVKENAFLSQTVRIQDDRGHTVCTTGPYAFVRHPMYAGIIQLMILIPLALGSIFTTIPAVLIDMIFVARTSLEDRTLQRELPGYAEYAERVRYRLIPGIW